MPLVVLNDYDFTKNEDKWKITQYANGYYKIVNAFDNFALDISAATHGTKVILKKNAPTDSQFWKITYITAGVYGVINKVTGLCLNMPKASANNTFVTQDDITNNSSRGWFFKPVNAMELDTVTMYSAANQKNINQIVVLPSNYKTDGKKYPVVYLLNGFAGNYLDYSLMAGQIRDYADQYGTIIVCADGNISSWYLNAIVNPAGSQYETYISSELVNFIDTHYRTVNTRLGRGIMGLSMGGHGSFYNAFRHQDVYSACASMSGCVDITRLDTIGLKTDYGLNAKLGPFSGSTAINWTNNAVVNLVSLIKPGVAGYFICLR